MFSPVFTAANRKKKPFQTLLSDRSDAEGGVDTWLWVWPILLAHSLSEEQSVGMRALRYSVDKNKRLYSLCSDALDTHCVVKKYKETFPVYGTFAIIWHQSEDEAKKPLCIQIHLFFL